MSLDSEKYQRYVEESLARRKEYEAREQRINRVAGELFASMTAAQYGSETPSLEEVRYLHQYAVSAVRKLEPVVMTMIIGLLDSEAELKASLDRVG